MTDDISRLVHAVRRAEQLDTFVDALSIEERDKLLESLTYEHRTRGYTLYTVKKAEIVTSKRQFDRRRYFCVTLVDKTDTEKRLVFSDSYELAIRNASDFVSAVDKQVGVTHFRATIYSDYQGTVQELVGGQVWVKETTKISGRTNVPYSSYQFLSTRR